MLRRLLQNTILLTSMEVTACHLLKKKTTGCYRSIGLGGLPALCPAESSMRNDDRCTRTALSIDDFIFLYSTGYSNNTLGTNTLKLG
jgi:hypothetical protein